MKILERSLAVLILLLISHIVNAQNFEVPKNVKLEKATDYPKYNKDIINCVTWLEETPVNEQQDKRKEAAAFLIQWITGSPDVSISLNADIVNFADKNPDLLIIYMGAYTKYVLENPDNAKDEVKANLAALRSVITVYNKVNGLKQDKNVEKLATLDKDGKLEKWITDKLKK